MKLGKLLAAGKNIINGSGEISYQASKNPLPKFGSNKNPFMPTAKPMATQDELPVKREPAAKTQKMETFSATPKSLATWTTKLNPMTMLRGSSAIERDVRPVQTELSLEKVKVLHNDLSDADVEFVPIKSRPQQDIPELQPARKSWEVLGERLMRATAL